MKIIRYNQDSVMQEISRILKTIEIKYTKISNHYETVETKRNADRYIDAFYKTDTLLAYRKLDKNLLLESGIVDTDLIDEIMKDKYKVPIDLVDKVLDLHRKVIIDNYVEKNNYYRIRIGLPPIKDDDKFFQHIVLTFEECELLKVPNMTRLHELNQLKLEEAEIEGIIKKYVKMYPEYEYLRYMGRKKLKLIEMRMAKNFEIIKVKVNSSMDSFDMDFLTTYVECREYFTEVIYNRYTGKKFAYYDEFIAMMIMVMTIQRTFAKTLKMGIERDYFDLYSIEALFQTYSVPYINNMTLEQKRLLIKNFNGLLRHKATDVVFYDILSLLGYTKVNILELWLVKEHRLDALGNPMFIYKDEALDSNKPDELTKVLDVEKMYDYNFKIIDKKEPNKLLHLTRMDNTRPYLEVTDPDPDWVEDQALREYLNTLEFNFVKTKYIDVNIMINLNKMLFELRILFSIIFNHKKELSGITIFIPKVIEDREIPLFDGIAIIVEVLYKLHGFAGNILYDPSKLMPVLGYNFDADFEKIKQDILNNPLIDDKLADLIPRFNVRNIDDLNELFLRITTFDDYIVEKMAMAESYDEYEAYNNIYKILTYCKDSKKYYTKRNGEVAKTYREFLLDLDPSYGEVIDRLNGELLDVYLTHIIYTLTKMIPNAKHLTSLNNINIGLLTGVVELMRRFKSLTTTIREIGIVYILDSRYYNMIHIKDKLAGIIGNDIQRGDFFRYADNGDRYGLDSGYSKINIYMRYVQEGLDMIKSYIETLCELHSDGLDTLLVEMIYYEILHIIGHDIQSSHMYYDDWLIIAGIDRLKTRFSLICNLDYREGEEIIQESETISNYMDILAQQFPTYMANELVKLRFAYHNTFDDRLRDLIIHYWDWYEMREILDYFDEIYNEDTTKDFVYKDRFGEIIPDRERWLNYYKEFTNEVMYLKEVFINDVRDLSKDITSLNDRFFNIRCEELTKEEVQYMETIISKYKNKYSCNIINGDIFFIDGKDRVKDYLINKEATRLFGYSERLETIVMNKDWMSYTIKDKRWFNLNINDRLSIEQKYRHSGNIELSDKEKLRKYEDNRKDLINLSQLIKFGKRDDIRIDKLSPIELVKRIFNNMILDYSILSVYSDLFKSIYSDKLHSKVYLKDTLKGIVGNE